MLCCGECFHGSDKTLEKYLGVHKHRFGLAEENNQVGEVTGLAWTSVGGEVKHAHVVTSIKHKSSVLKGHFRFAKLKLTSL